MKKIIFLSMAFVVTTQIMFSQNVGPNNPCAYREEISVMIRTADSLSGFVRYMRETLTRDQWTAFITDIQGNAGMAAFSNCGSYSEQFSQTCKNLGKTLDMQYYSLIISIDPGRTMTGKDLANKVTEAFNCYLSDTISSNSSEVNAASGFPGGPDLAEGGPCESAARTCFGEAKRNYHSAVRQCATLGIGASGLLSPWLGAGAGLICLIQAGNDEWNDVQTCIANYNECIGR